MSRPLKLSEAIAIGLHSAAFMSWRAPERVALRTISERFQVSEAHCSKVLQRLVKAGLVESTRGPKGGFSLAEKPEGIRLVEVYEAIEGPLETHGCLFQEPMCDGTDCILGDVLLVANQQLAGYLRRTRLVDLHHIFEREPEGDSLVRLGTGRGE